MKKQYGLIGYPLGHSMSAFIHKRLFELSKQDAEYLMLEFPPEKLDEKAKELKKLAGFNITMPYKKDILQYLDGLDEKALLYGAVNTVNCGKKVVGCNTDVVGFLKSTDLLGGIANKKICIIGAGATAKMAATEAVLANSEVTIAVREGSLSKADNLCFDVARLSPTAKVSATTISQITEHYDMLINCTPVGMYPKTDAMPIDEDKLGLFNSVLDLIYNPIETNLIRCAKAKGLSTSSGMTMLVWQAVIAHEIWYFAKFEQADIDKLIADASEHLAKIR